MAATPLSESFDPALASTPLPAQPYDALHVHFGMLLGVQDFECEQSYHRGKHRLHNAWQHGAGVAWGLGVSVVEATGEVRVEAGLALDGAGRELHLDAAACVVVADWVAQLAEADRNGLVGAARDAPFTVHVVLRHRACLARQVPALLEPCDGSGRDTDWSRVHETVTLALVPGPAPQPDDAGPRLRVLFGLAAPRAGEAGDLAIVAARDALLALPRADRLPALLTLLRRCANEDAIDRRPRIDAGDDAAGALFPQPESAGLVLAEVQGLQLAPVAGSEPPRWALAVPGSIDLRARRSLVDTATLQELLAALFFCCGDAAEPPEEPAPSPAPADRARARPAAAEPAFDGAALRIEGRRVVLPASTALLAATVTPAAFDAALLGPDGWKPLRISAATLAADGRSVVLQFPSRPAPAPGGALRLVARTAGSTPVLAADLRPLRGSTPGGDFVHMHPGS